MRTRCKSSPRRQKNPENVLWTVEAGNRSRISQEFCKVTGISPPKEKGVREALATEYNRTEAKYVFFQALGRRLLRKLNETCSILISLCAYLDCRELRVLLGILGVGSLSTFAQCQKGTGYYSPCLSAPHLSTPILGGTK